MATYLIHIWKEQEDYNIRRYPNLSKYVVKRVLKLKLPKSAYNYSYDRWKRIINIIIDKYEEYVPPKVTVSIVRDDGRFTRPFWESDW